MSGGGIFLLVVFGALAIAGISRVISDKKEARKQQSPE